MKRVTDLVWQLGEEFAKSGRRYPRGGRLMALLVEDDTNDQELFSDTFRRIGCDLTIARDGESAVELLSKNMGEPGQPDFQLAFVDLNLPGMDGVEVVRRIHEAAPDLPIVIVSGHPERIREVRKICPVVVVDKPLSRDHAKTIFRQCKIGE